RVFLGRIHITFGIHYFIEFPIHYWSAGNPYGKHIRFPEHKGCGHESAKAPAVDTQSFSVDKGKGFQVFHPFHLICHFHRTEVPEYCLFKSEPAVSTSTTIHGKYHITTLCHVFVPQIATSGKTIGEQLDVRTVIKIN